MQKPEETRCARKGREMQRTGTDVLRSDIFDRICSLVCREKRNTCHIHSLFYLCLTCKTSFQFIFAFNSVNGRAGAAETMTASTSAFPCITGIFHCRHNGKFGWNTVSLTAKIYVYHISHIGIPILSLTFAKLYSPSGFCQARFRFAASRLSFTCL